METTINNLMRKVLITGVLLLIIPSVFAQFTYPESEPAQIAKAYFTSFNSSNDSLMKIYIPRYRTSGALERLTVEQRLDQFKRMKEQLYTLTPKHVVNSNENELHLHLYSGKADSWFKVRFIMSEEEDGKLESFLFRPARPPKNDNQTQEWENLEELLALNIKDKDTPGIGMAVIEKNKLKQVQVAGVRNKFEENAIKKSDRFHIGSLTKSMTATIIGKLVEDKQLSFDQTLSSIFPKIPMRDEYKNVTVRQLLDHTAGIQQYLETTHEEEQMAAQLPENPKAQRFEFTKYVLNQQPVSTPGTSMVYSNAGYGILGAITEQVTNESWEQLITKHIFKPLGMKNSGFGWPRDTGTSQPLGHILAGNSVKLAKLAKPDYQLAPYIDPAGDIHCSLKDLSKFVLMHLKGLQGIDTHIKASTIQSLHDTDNQKPYAGGWIITKDEHGETKHLHYGSAETFFSYMAIFPNSRRAVVLLSNYGDVSMSTIFQNLEADYFSN